MAIRQYIGARYMPKFVGVYDNTTEYEALSVVDNGMGTNYISRIPTPAGTPLTNTTYWLIYGSSNGAILDLQGRMTTAEGDIDDLQGRMTTAEGDIDSLESDVALLNYRKFIIIGDSYGLELDNNSKTYIDHFKSNLGLNDDQLYSNCVGGASFYGVDNDHKFATLLANVSVSNPSEITDIIVECGANDLSNSAGATLSGMTDFSTYAKSHFPNAKLWIFGCGLIMTEAKETNRLNNLFPVMLYSASIGFNFITNSEYVLCDTDFLKSDVTHPNQYGIRRIAAMLAQGIMTGAVDIVNSVEWGYSNLGLISPDTSGTTYALYGQANNGISMYRNNGLFKTSLRTNYNGFVIISSAAMNIVAGNYFKVQLPKMLGVGSSVGGNVGIAIGDGGKIYPIQLELECSHSVKQLNIYIPTGIPSSDNITTLKCYFDMIIS